MLDKLAKEWHRFRDDAPGERFENHYRRKHEQGSRAAALVRVGLGVILLLGGLVLLAMPGPGLIVSALGLALLAGESSHLARALDRIEPPIRRGVRAVKRWWLELVPRTKVAIVANAILLVGIATFATVRMLQS